MSTRELEIKDQVIKKKDSESILEEKKKSIVEVSNG